MLTAVRVSGHTLTDFRRLFDDRIHPFAEVDAFQVRDPRSGPGSVISALAAEEPQHPPLFYVLDHFALDAFGSSVAAYRSVSVAAGLLSILFAFALGRIAFGSTTGGLVLAALVAVSPFHVQLSRQAREYELFSNLTLASSALVLWAAARPSFLRWAAYAVGIALGLYTDPLFAGVIAAHAITVAATQRTRAALGGFAAACAAALLAFAPWAVVLLAGREAAHSQLGWLAGTYPLKFYAEKWAFNLGTVGFDAELRDLRLGAFVALFLLLIAIASFHALRRAFDARPEPAAVLALGLTAIPPLAFGAYDLVARAHYTTVARYFAGTAVGVELLVASWLTACLATQGRARALGLAVFAAVAAGGIGSDLTAAGASTWWDNNTQINFRSVGAVIDGARRPLVVVAEPSAALVLDHLIPPDARFLLVSDPARGAAVLRRSAGPAFLIAPSEALKAAVLRSGRALSDVSPANVSAMSEFRAGLSRERPDLQAALGPDTAANAVWSVGPAGPTSR